MNNDDKLDKSRKLSSWFVSKEILCHDWIDSTDVSRNRKIKQGEIYMCELGENLGYEICKTRPVLIISADQYSSSGQVTIIPLTSTPRKIRVHYVLKKNKYNFLMNDSTLKVDQTKSVSTARLTARIGRIDTDDLTRVKTRLKTLFGI